MKISVFGLGYVGIVNIACLSELGHTLYGCDIKPHKVNLLNDGKSTVLEPGVEERIAEGVQKGTIIGTQDAARCVADTEMALVCVGTPSDASGNVNLNYMLNTATEIAKLVLAADKEFVLVARSTIPPGTIEDLIMPEVKRIMGDKAGLLKLAFLPEFLREGSAVKDFFGGARVVAGVDEVQSAGPAIREVFGFAQDTPLILTNFRTAEFVKYVDNAYHAVKVAFANEVYSVGAALGADVPLANDIFLMDPILNISQRYLRPGMPFGGSCLPKDLRAILHFGRVTGTEVPFFQGVAASNQAHQARVMQKVTDCGRNKILLYGITFKQNTDDIRESPFLFLLKDLAAQGYDVKVYDPNLSMQTLRIEWPEIVKYVESDRDALIDWAELIVVNKREMEDILQRAGADTDVVNCIDNKVYVRQAGKAVVNLY